MRVLMLFCSLFWLNKLAAQHEIRYFLDVPGFFAHAPNAKNLKNAAGLKSEIAFLVGTHFLIARSALQFVGTIAPTAEDVEKTVKMQPIGRLEIGVGPFRTNGQRCARTHQNAFTLQGRAAILYNFEAKNTDFGFGLETAHFLIRDYRRNTELVLRSEYQIKSKQISLDFGFRFFLNLRPNG